MYVLRMGNRSSGESDGDGDWTPKQGDDDDNSKINGEKMYQVERMLTAKIFNCTSKSHQISPTEVVENLGPSNNPPGGLGGALN